MQLAGRDFLPIAFAARLPLAMLTVGALTLATAVSGSYVVGGLAAGALPRPFPTISLGEVFLNPTSMMYRNLMAMDTEEMIGAQPMDAVVLIGGCDKTVPAQLMGAASADLPAIQLVTVPMSTEAQTPAPSGSVRRWAGP